MTSWGIGRVAHDKIVYSQAGRSGYSQVSQKRPDPSTQLRAPSGTQLKCISREANTRSPSISPSAPLGASAKRAGSPLRSLRSASVGMTRL